MKPGPVGALGHAFAKGQNVPPDGKGPRYALMAGITIAPKLCKVLAECAGHRPNAHGFRTNQS